MAINYLPNTSKRIYQIELPSVVRWALCLAIARVLSNFIMWKTTSSSHTKYILTLLLAMCLKESNKSVYPFDRIPLFFECSPDLYGPLWIYFTLNIWIAIFGCICSYMDKVLLGMNDKYRLQAHKLSSWYILLAVYFFVIPFLLNLLFFFTVNRYPGYVKLLAVYGYSFSIYLPATMLYLIPNDACRWAILSISGIISLFWICKELIGTLMNNFDLIRVKLILLVQWLMHVLFTLMLKYYFFV